MNIGSACTIDFGYGVNGTANSMTWHSKTYNSARGGEGFEGDKLAGGYMKITTPAFTVPKGARVTGLALRFKYIDTGPGIIKGCMYNKNPKGNATGIANGVCQGMNNYLMARSNFTTKDTDSQTEVCNFTFSNSGIQPSTAYRIFFGGNNFIRNIDWTKTQNTPRDAHVVGVYNTYKVVFKGNGSTSGSMSNQSFTYNTAQKLTACNFSKTGHYFGGWANSSTATNAVYDDKESVKNLTTANGGVVNLFAHWKPNILYIQFNINGGSLDGSNTSLHIVNGLISKTSNNNPHKYNGFKYGGNSNLPDGDTTYGITPPKGYSCTKVWTKSRGSSSSDFNWTSSYIYNTNQILNASQYKSLANDNLTITLYAQWKKNISILYNLNTSDTVSNTPSNTVGTVYYPTANVNLTVNSKIPSRTGYTFKGWATSSTGSVNTSWNPGSSITNLTADKTLYANWSINSYTVTVNAGTGIDSVSGGGSKKYNSEVTVSATVKTGYKFSKWTGTNISNSTSTSYKFTMPAKNVSLTASASIITYNISYNLAGGAATGLTNTYNVTSNVTLPVPTKTGYYFNGWTGTDLSSAATSVSFTNKTGDRSYTATWIAKQLKVIFNNNDGSGASTNHTYTYGANSHTPFPLKTRNGYYHTRWDLNSDGSGSDWDATSTVIDSWIGNRVGSGKTTTLNLYALWNPYTLSVNYYPNGATSGTDGGTAISNLSAKIKTSTYKYDTTYENGLVDMDNADYTNLQRTGYRPGKAWSIYTNGASPVNQYTSYTGQALASALGQNLAAGNKSVNVYAVWTANTYTIKYQGNGNTSGSTNDSSHKYDVAKTLTPNGFKKTYKVTFNANGGNTSKASQTANYKFAGWSNTASGSVKYEDEESVKNLTTTHGATVNLYAQWTSTAVTFPTANECTREGYKLLGFSTSSTATTASYNPGSTYTPTAAKTFYAVWDPLGLVRIYNGSSFQLAIPYVYNNNKWSQAMAYVYKDSTNGWKIGI